MHLPGTGATIGSDAALALALLTGTLASRLSCLRSAAVFGFVSGVRRAAAAAEAHLAKQWRPSQEPSIGAAQGGEMSRTATSPRGRAAALHDALTLHVYLESLAEKRNALELVLVFISSVCLGHHVGDGVDGELGVRHADPHAGASHRRTGVGDRAGHLAGGAHLGVPLGLQRARHAAHGVGHALADAADDAADDARPVATEEATAAAAPEEAAVGVVVVVVIVVAVVADTVTVAVALVASCRTGSR